MPVVLGIATNLPSFSEGLSLRTAHPGLRGKHINLPYGFVGTFPNPTLLRSWTYHSPGTELFLFATHKYRGQNTNRNPHPPAATLLHTSKQKTQHAGIAS